jgi:hypothetical protein
MSRRGKEMQSDLQVISSEAKNAPQPTSTEAVKPDQIPVSFDDWYLRVQHGRGWRPEMKKAIKAHFEARGFMKSKEFTKGLEDFGFKA